MNTEEQPQTEARELTFGEKACGVNFNPGGHPGVTLIKADFAMIVDRLNDAREEIANSEAKRMLSIAITAAQTAQMWAVKAITWQH